MFTLAFDRHHKILLARVSGVLSSNDVSELDDAMGRFTARHGPVHGLMDCSSVSTVAVPVSRLVQQDGSGSRRMVVVSHPELLALAPTTARQPMIVTSMAAALRQLGATDPSFEPVDKT